MEERAQLVRRGERLEYLTIGWNSIEALVAIVAGVIAGSIALVGFGVDSVIESISGGVLLWRLHHDRDVARRELAEQRAIRLVGLSFLILAGYVAIDAVNTLIHRERPDESLPGILLAIVSLIVMPLLARAKRKVAVAINSGALHADSRQTDICAYLSAILLGGLLLNALLGWWWADPVAALVMVPIIAKEGVEGVRGNSCCCGPTCATTAATAEESCCEEPECRG